MIALEEAQQHRFERATREELAAYLGQIGEEAPPRAKPETLRKMLLDKLGIADAMTQGLADKVRPIATRNGGDSVLPPYNLSADGLWQGRRHRIKLPRPEGSRIARADSFSFNGKAPYWIPYDEVVSIPEPILNILRTNKRRRIVQTQTDIGNGVKEVTTGWEFDDLPFSYLGIDPETQDRAGSMTEWYQLKGPAWFEARSVRELQLIATKISLPTRRDKGEPKDQAELIGDLKLFFFGYADAVEAA